MPQAGEKILPHRHESRRAPGGEVEAADQFGGPWLGRLLEEPGGAHVRIAKKRGGGRLQRGNIRPEAARDIAEKSGALRLRQSAVGRQHLLGQSHAGRLAPPGKQRLRQREKAGPVAAHRARIADQQPAAVGDGLDQVGPVGGADFRVHDSAWRDSLVRQ